MFITEDKGATWSFVQKMVASDGGSGEKFGEAVGVHGNTVVVGAWQRLSNDAGEMINLGSWVLVACVYVKIINVHSFYLRWRICFFNG